MISCLVFYWVSSNIMYFIASHFFSSIKASRGDVFNAIIIRLQTKNNNGYYFYCAPLYLLTMLTLE